MASTILMCLLVAVVPLVAAGVDTEELPTVLIVVLARNKAHTLPYSLGCLERLDYPASRLALRVVSDHNEDDTILVLRRWLTAVTSHYHHVNVTLDDTRTGFSGQSGPYDWTEERFHHMMSVREEALSEGRRLWADYVFFVDADNFVANPGTLRALVRQKKTLVAPLLTSLESFSNFWAGQDEHGYYRRTDDYLPILRRERVGCFSVPMIHSTFLVDLRRVESRQLTFDPRLLPGYDKPRDDIIVFAESARRAGVERWVCNDQLFGRMLEPLEPDFTLDDDVEHFRNLRLDEIGLLSPTPMMRSEHAPQDDETRTDKLGFDEVYLINLERRPQRLSRMEECFKVLLVNFTLFSAVDGQRLNQTYLDQLGVRQVPEFEDPHHKRPVKLGEIGCFLSHYYIWQDMLARGHRWAAIFEDDINFQPFFRSQLSHVVQQAADQPWDLLYLGRKRFSQDEPHVPGKDSLVYPGYTYWTLSYVLTARGAEKLVKGDPLGHIVPVDEYLPIMFDRHPRHDWNKYFPVRDVVALSAHPLLVHPTHYTGQDNYVSDTEDSTIVAKDEL